MRTHSSAILKGQVSSVKLHCGNLHCSLPLQPDPSKTSHHVLPNPRAHLSTHTLHLCEWLPPRKGQHRLPNRDRDRRVHDRHSGFLQQPFPGAEQSSHHGIHQRGQQLAGPGLQLADLRGRIRNRCVIMGYGHSGSVPSRQSHANRTSGPRQPISASIELRTEMRMSSITPSASLSSGKPASAITPRVITGTIARIARDRRLVDGQTRILGPSLRSRSVRPVRVVCRGI